MNTFSYESSSLPPINFNHNSVVQNFYDDSNPVIDKIKAAHSVSFLANCNQQTMKINFLSVPSLKTNYLLGPAHYASSNSPEKGPNFAMLNWVRDYPGRCLGVIIMDFPGMDLIKAIISSQDVFINLPLVKTQGNPFNANLNPMARNFYY